MVAGVVKDKKVVETEVLDLQMMLKQRSIVGSAIDIQNYELLPKTEYESYKELHC